MISESLYFIELLENMHRSSWEIVKKYGNILLVGLFLIFSLSFHLRYDCLLFNVVRRGYLEKINQVFQQHTKHQHHCSYIELRRSEIFDQKLKLGTYGDPLIWVTGFSQRQKQTSKSQRKGHVDYDRVSLRWHRRYIMRTMDHSLSRDCKAR